MKPQIKKTYTISITWTKAPDKTIKYHFITKLEKEISQDFMVLYKGPKKENNKLTEMLLEVLKPKTGIS